MNCQQYDDVFDHNPCPNPATALLVRTYYSDGSETRYWSCDDHAWNLPRHIQRVPIGSVEEAAREGTAAEEAASK